MGRKRCLLLVWLAVLLLLAAPLYGQSILTQAVSGTGFIVSSDGYIITNRHVINGATKISVTIGNKEYEARVVDSISDNDIALLKVDAHGLPAVMLGDSDDVQIGDTVYAIGCPAGVCGTITQGRVANLGISSKTDEGITLHNLIMSDLTTTHGSSGGPLLDDRGEVIGITTAGIVVQGETTGFGVSIPISQAIPLLRRVPGFSASQMGKATTVLTLDEIRHSVGAGTTFVQAEIQRPLSDLLPRQALGRALALVVGPPRLLEGDWPTLATRSLWNYLKKNDINMNWVAEAYNKTVSGNTTEEITIDVFDCASATDASRALTYLSAPTTWDLADPFSNVPSDPLFVYDPFIFGRTWAGMLQGSDILLSASQELRSMVVKTVITSHIYPNQQDLGDLVFGCWSSVSEIRDRKFIPSLSLWGFASFTVDNLAFSIVYYAHLSAGSSYPPCDMTGLVPNGIPYDWKRIGHSFVFSAENSRLFSVDYDPFIDNFDQVITTVFQALVNQ